jgi:hypothetical protein
VTTDASVIEQATLDPWSLQGLRTMEVHAILGENAIKKLDFLVDCGLLYCELDGSSVEFLRACDAVALARYFASHLNRDHDEAIRMAHLLLGSNCAGKTSLGHIVELDIIRHAAMTCALNPNAPMQLHNAKLLKAHGAEPAKIGDTPIKTLDDVPRDTVLQMSLERGQDGIWLEREGDEAVVHFVQVKGGERDEGKPFPCGEGTSTSSDTLVTVTHRMLTRSWPDIKALLGSAAEASQCNLVLGKLVLLTTRAIPDRFKKRYQELTATFGWVEVDGQRRTLEICDNLESILHEKHRHYYVKS